MQLYLQALEVCRGSQETFARITTNFVLSGTGSGKAICTAYGKGDLARSLHTAQLQKFSEGFVQLLKQLYSGRPKDFGNGIMVRQVDPNPPNFADVAAYEKQMTAEDAHGPSQPQPPSCYGPSATRQALAELVDGSGTVTYSKNQGVYLASKTDDDPPQSITAGAVRGSDPSPGKSGSDGSIIKTVTLFDFANVRLRGYPAQLIDVSTTGSDPALADADAALYLAGDSAKLSFSEQSGSNVVSNDIVGAIGYSIAFPSLSNNPKSWFSSLDLTPYFATDREAKFTNTHTSQTESLSVNTWDAGAVLDLFGNPGVGDENAHFKSYYFLVRPDHLGNYLDHSEIWSLNFRWIPVVEGIFSLNHLHSAFDENNVYKYSLLVDLRYQQGFFTARGDNRADLRLNDNFSRLGGMVGAALEINWLPSNPIDLMAKYTDFLPLEGFNKSLGLFETEATFSFGPNKGFGITAEYENGRRDDTAQQYEAWSIALTFKL